jgi:hypothetical protein
VIGEDLAVRLAEDVPKHESSDDRVVQRTDQGDELRDEVKRREEPRDGEPQPPLAALGNARVAEQSSKEDDEVWEQTRQFPRLRTSAEEDQDKDPREPQTEDESDREQQAAKHASSLRLPLPCVRAHVVPRRREWNLTHGLGSSQPRCSHGLQQLTKPWG